MTPEPDPASQAVETSEANEEAEDEKNLTVDGRKPIEKIHPRLVVCEGNSDKAVIDALLRTHGIGGIQVEYAGGRDKFSTFLRAARVKHFKWVLLIADCDDNPNESFSYVRTQLTTAKYKPPANRRQKIEPTARDPGVEVLMLPWDTDKGCLESVCLPALEELYPDEYKCLETYCTCTGTDGWGVTKRDEMKVHCLISCTQKKNPRVGLKMFAERTACPLNFKHDCFKQVVEHLRVFAAYPE